MPASSEETRRLLVEAATHEFADHGVRGASLLEISRRAGQRNRASVHYHFGSRDGILAAVLSQHHRFLYPRNVELHAAAEKAAPGDLLPVVRALALPAIEIGETGPLGRGYLTILAELAVHGVDRTDPAVLEAMTTSGGYLNYQLLGEQLGAAQPGLPPALRDLRRDKSCQFLMRTVADRDRDLASAGEGMLPEAVSLEDYTANLIAMTVGMLSAPL